jgi:23S rRNA pseudouridine2605 synthase
MMAAEGAEKLQKVLARAGVASRRAVELLIMEGRVSVNGEVAEVGARVDPRVDVLEVDGALVAADPDLVHYLLHKPSGVVSTANDPQGRPTVVALVPDEPRVFPVGRLDADTEGLLLLTNDGELTNRITHPSQGVEKEYLAEVDGEPSRGALRLLREGVELDDGRTAPAKASLVAPTVLRLVIRTRIGPITDTTLKAGEWRVLTSDEVSALARAVAGTGDEPPTGPR